MNQTAIGSYIARKRREQNLTQEQLAQQLGVSNKTISKWENGKCMPDYSIIESLCEALGVTLPERMDGEGAADGRSGFPASNLKCRVRRYRAADRTARLPATLGDGLHGR